MKLPYKWVWRNRIGYMIYAKEVGTQVFVVQLIRAWRIRFLGKHYGPFKPVEYTIIDGSYRNSGHYRHLTVWRFQFSVMPIEKLLWHNF